MFRKYLKNKEKNNSKKVLTEGDFGVILWKLSTKTELLQKNEFKNNSKKCLTNTNKCGKLVKLLR